MMGDDAPEDERTARELCVASGWRPETLGYLQVPFDICTPRGIFRTFQQVSQIELWTCYLEMARNLISIKNATPDPDPDSPSS